jgi:hypothetical protein
MLMLPSLSTKRSLENTRAIDFMLRGQFGISHGIGRRLTQHYGEDSIQAVFRKMRALYGFFIKQQRTFKNSNIYIATDEQNIVKTLNN